MFSLSKVNSSEDYHFQNLLDYQTYAETLNFDDATSNISNESPFFIFVFQEPTLSLPSFVLNLIAFSSSSTSAGNP